MPIMLSSLVLYDFLWYNDFAASFPLSFGFVSLMTFSSVVKGNVWSFNHAAKTMLDAFWTTMMYHCWWWQYDTLCGFFVRWRKIFFPCVFCDHPIICCTSRLIIFWYLLFAPCLSPVSLRCCPKLLRHYHCHSTAMVMFSCENERIITFGGQYFRFSPSRFLFLVTIVVRRWWGCGYFSADDISLSTVPFSYPLSVR